MGALGSIPKLLNDYACQLGFNNNGKKINNTKVAINFSYQHSQNIQKVSVIFIVWFEKNSSSMFKILRFKFLRIILRKVI